MQPYGQSQTPPYQPTYQLNIPNRSHRYPSNGQPSYGQLISTYDEAIKFVTKLSQPDAITDSFCSKNNIITVSQAIEDILYKRNLLKEFKCKAEQSFQIISANALISSWSSKVKMAQLLNEKLEGFIQVYENTLEYEYSFTNKNLEQDTQELTKIKEEIKNLDSYILENGKQIFQIKNSSSVGKLIRQIGEQTNLCERQNLQGLEGNQLHAQSSLAQYKLKQKDLELQIEMLTLKCSKLKLGLENRLKLQNAEIPKLEKSTVLIPTSSPYQFDLIKADLAKMSTIDAKEWIDPINETKNGKAWLVSKHPSGQFLFYQNLDNSGKDMNFSSISNEYYDWLIHGESLQLCFSKKSISLPIEKMHWKSDKSLVLGNEFSIKKFLDHEGKESLNGYKIITNITTNKDYLVDKQGNNYEEQLIEAENAIIGSSSWIRMNPCEYQFTCFNGIWQRATEIEAYNTTWVILPDWITNDSKSRSVRSRDGKLIVQVNIETGVNVPLEINSDTSSSKPFKAVSLDGPLFRIKNQGVIEACGQSFSPLQSQQEPLNKNHQHQNGHAQYQQPNQNQYQPYSNQQQQSHQHQNAHAQYQQPNQNQYQPYNNQYQNGHAQYQQPNQNQYQPYSDQQQQSHQHQNGHAQYQQPNQNQYQQYGNQQQQFHQDQGERAY